MIGDRSFHRDPRVVTLLAQSLIRADREQALYRLVQEGRITQEEALANADSATNLLWLLNNGPDSRQARQAPAEPAPSAANDTPGASFTEFTLDS